MWTKSPIRPLGWASDGEVLLAEEDRVSHIHILGSPGSGKSKLLELLICQDIKLSQWRVANNKTPCGSCLLDSSPNGDTAYDVLRYCIANNIKKVLLIDPRDARNSFGKVATLNPINLKVAPNVVAQNVMDAMRILWGDKGHEKTSRIDRYLPAVISVLRKAKATLRDAVYFTDRTNRRFEHIRDHILAQSHPYDRDRILLEEAFYNPRIYAQEYLSTTGRLFPLFDPIMELFIGSTASPIDFVKMISEGWIILVVLDKTNVWGEEQQRLLGTLVLNQLFDAISFLRNNTPWRGKYYIYIDEAGKYATPNVADILDYTRHLGMRFTFAHQRFDQLEDRNVRSAIKSAKIKALFNTFNREDRDEMIRMMYGGEISDRAISYELMNLPSRHAAIKINMNPPRITRLTDVKTPEVSPEEMENAKHWYYRQDWYRSPEDIRNEIDARFTTTSTKGQAKYAGYRPKPTPGQSTSNPVPSEPGTPDDGGTDSPLTALRRKRGGVKTV